VKKLSLSARFGHTLRLNQVSDTGFRQAEDVPRVSRFFINPAELVCRRSYGAVIAKTTIRLKVVPSICTP